MSVPLLPRRLSNAFTLIELLAVVAILGVLVALLLPVLGKMRDRAAGAKCASNLRQIGVAAMNYVAERDGTLPHGGYASGSAPNDNKGWYYQLDAYGLPIQKNGANWTFPSVLYCPLSGRDGSGGWPAHNPDYGINRNVAGNGSIDRKKIVSVQNPSKTILFAETGQPGNALKGDFIFLRGGGFSSQDFISQAPQESAADYSKGGYMAFRHPRPSGEEQNMTACFSNVLFCDGHVESIAWSDERLQTEEGRRQLVMP